MHTRFNDKQQAFLESALSQYVKEGGLSPLLALFATKMMMERHPC